MRFLTFELTAYGPFTDKGLDLSRGDLGLHLIYGPNEAGKSAALRALTNLLYGIPPRANDNFLHDNPRLRIGAEILHSDGSKLHIVRRKGLKDTLLAPSGAILSDAVLDKYLADITRELFTTMFGMDHEVLVEGGRALVSGSGDIGQSLFAAGMGISGMRDIIESLEAEAGELFRPRGKITTINRLIQDFKTLKKQCTKRSLSSTDWTVHDEGLRSAIREKQVVEQDLQKHLSDRNRLERFQKAIPRIVSLQGHRAELEKMGEVVFLPSEFSEQRQREQEILRRAQFSEARLNKDLDKINEDILKISPAESLIQAQDEIKDLFLRLGSHRKAMLDLPRRRADNYRLLEEAQAILKKLGPQWSIENAESLRLTDSQIARIRKLGRELDPLLERLQANERTKSDLESEIKSAKEELARLPEEKDPQKLETVLAQTRKQGDLSGYLLKIKAELETRQKQVDLHLKGLGLWTGSMAELETMAVPSYETVDQFERDFSELNARLQRFRVSVDEQNERLLSLDRQMEALRAAGSVPSEEELAFARKRRNKGWRLVKDAWLLGKTDIEKTRDLDPEAKDLAEAYEKSVRAADEIGDRLRNESERVAKQAGFMADHQETLKRIASFQEDIERATEALSKLETLWIGLWEPLRIHPRTPKEMSGWLQKYDRLMAGGADVRERQAELDRVISLIDDLRSNLSDRLKEMAEGTADADEKLDHLMDRCDAVVKATQNTERRRENLVTRIKDLELRITTATQNIRQAEEAQRVWQQKWGVAVAGLSLDAQSLPVEADAVLDRINELFERVDQAQLMQGRIRAIQGDGKEFSQSVKDLCGRVAIDLETVPPEEAAAVLNARLGKALMDAARLDELEKRRKATVQAIRSERIIIEEREAMLQEMCQRAGTSSYEELPEIERRSITARDKKERIEALEDELAEYSAGADIEAFIQEVGQIDADGLPGEIANASGLIQRLEQKRSELDQLIGSERTALEAMDGGADAAELAEMSQAVLAELRDGVERYVRVHIASVVLRKEMERYREANQGPILKRASDIFAVLTLNSFEGLVSDFDEKDNPILMGIRPSGKKVSLEGMSDGTSDQLYLSLRLASLEQRLLNTEPIPLILDDILINFDDDRSKATLKALEAISKRTQIIFFTHHRHLVELARAHVSKDVLFTHTLV